MLVHRSGSPHRTRSLATVAGALLALFALLLGLPGSATAAATPAKDAPEPSHPAQDWAGSQIAAHEGTGSVRPATGLLAGVEGVDVSGHQGNVDWSALWNSGVKFAYVKATESTTYTNPSFAQQYNGSYTIGMIRGAYHFATPNTSSGAAQANYFVDHGGGWSKDGKTLPGALDMEYNPYGDTCYGMTATGLVNWMKDWFATYKSRTGRDAVIYTSTSWWKQCTGNNTGFGSVNPLWVPRYGSSVGELPGGWGFHTIWQYTSTGPNVGDHNSFNGAYDRLQALANG
ncbi:lysozyme [Streptomyces benahoarensis]|uniref:Lysozyme n=1 Tax=Streptomyces benahoarensis TaxID=2595054 RepID=A0A553YVV1_9ACTN|nr:lysozyme [Streptomyces benahoarensis]TSB18046.1 lysozyme [Streptomyces benahoarensis]TSB33341.1 lysozyme [Streptomyces benahoarensis]